MRPIEAKDLKPGQIVKYEDVLFFICTPGWYCRLTEPITWSVGFYNHHWRNLTLVVESDLGSALFPQYLKVTNEKK